MGGSQVTGATSVAESLALYGTAHLTLNAPGKPGLHLWSAEELEKSLALEARKVAAKALRDYAEETHRHQANGVGLCSVIHGDRCDITAALRALAKRIEEQ